jgi:hypothetical protein
MHEIPHVGSMYDSVNMAHLGSCTFETTTNRGLVSTYQVCKVQFGSHEWLINRAKFPKVEASMYRSSLELTLAKYHDAEPLLWCFRVRYSPLLMYSPTYSTIFVLGGTSVSIRRPCPRIVSATTVVLGYVRLEIVWFWHRSMALHRLGAHSVYVITLSH